MSHFHLLHTRSCHNLLVPSRVRRQAIEARFDKSWRELRRHVTIESDPRKLSQLRRELEKQKTDRGYDLKVNPKLHVISTDASA